MDANFNFRSGKDGPQDAVSNSGATLLDGAPLELVGLDEFTLWLDEKLAELESRFEDFHIDTPLVGPHGR